MKAFIVLCCLSIGLATYGGEVQVSKKLQWAKTNKQIEVSPDKYVEALFLPGTFNDPKKDFLPVYQYNLQLSSDAVLDISLASSKFEPVAKLPAGFNSSKLSSSIQFSYTIGYLKKKPVARITFIPVVKNATGKIERLTEFQLKIDVMSTGKPRASTPTYASSSVLSSGSWYKVTVTADGVYKMDYNFLKSLGINVGSINPNDIHVYGNGGGLLPEYNSAFRHDDLVEDPIIVSTATPGVFQQGDFVLFYGQSPNTWYYDSTGGHFLHQWNYYSNTNTYFITVNSTQGKRIATLSQASNPNTTVTSFDDHQLYHTDNYNLIQSGLIWYTDMFNFSVTSENLSFNFPNLITGQPIYIGTDIAAASTAESSTFTFTANGQQIISQSLGTVSGNSEETYAQVASPSATFTTNSNPVNITVAFNNGSSSAQGWLDYIELNARRNLISTGAQMSFRDSRSVGANNVSTFNLQSVDGNTHVLDVTDPTNAQMVNGTLNNGTFSFTLNTSTLREFFIYQDNGTFPAPTPVGAVPNQNLHGINQATMVIVSDSSLMSAANSLAAYDRSSLGLNVAVVDKQQIFNEFSTGNQDVTAIRDFVRMLYNRAGTDAAQMPQYLILYGKTSYDYKNIEANNTNFVPIYESQISNDPVNSICSDDYFGLLDPEEGSDGGGGEIGFINPGYADMVDIAIGRIPVTTVEEGNQILAKIMNYASKAAQGSWRNDVTFVADDYDTGDLHEGQAEGHAEYLQNNFPVFNVDKIYADAYKAVSTPAGLRNPDVNAAIDAKVATGTLIMNWIGHGSSICWSHERVLTFEDINSWTNFNMMPLFVTATCQFTEFDEPPVSAGEQVILNPVGGGIALVSTTRLSESGSNDETNSAFLQALFTPTTITNGERIMPPLGTAVMLTKALANNGINSRKFELFGDPSLTLAFPKYNVVTTEVNVYTPPTINDTIVPDTLKALERVTIKGEVRDLTGKKMQNFNGVLYPTIFDKEIDVKTLGNYSPSNITVFQLLKNIIFQGESSVSAGNFTFTFVVPKDIAYNYGWGKISYYADNSVIDANGYTAIPVGGYSGNTCSSRNGPSLKLYMNNTQFVYGGLTNSNPTLLVELFDSGGINTVGSVGHDITGVLDNNTQNTFVLNNYYQATINSYQSGTIQYPLSNLSNGVHNISVRAWDVCDNTSQGVIEFVVSSSAGLALSHVFNYPNPFTTSTNFQFEHNKPGELLLVEVKIFSVSGKLIKTIQQQVQTDGYRVDNIHWDGLDEYGNRIGRGVYVYKLSVSAPEGGVADQFEKLVILR